MAKIVVVEDQPEHRHLLGNFLQVGHEVFEAGSGAEALILARTERPDLIICKMPTPLMDGYELVRRLRADTSLPYLPVIFYTACHHETEPRSLAQLIEVSEVICNPCSATTLLVTVDKALAREGSPAPLTPERECARAHRHLPIGNLIRKVEELEARIAQREAELAAREDTLKRERAERLRVVGELQQKEQLLIRQGRLAALGEMIGNIAHQWRQPLNSLGLLVQQPALLCEYGEVDRQILKEMARKSMEIINHMSQTIEDFRNFFQPDKEKVPFRVQEVVAKTLSLINDSYRSQFIELKVQASGDPVVQGFPNEFSQVLLNLLANARDALTDRAVPSPRVDVKVGLENANCAVVVITDNAGGIPEDIIDCIFEPYFTTKSSHGGTGLGLFMSKTIIENNMNGRLTVKNVNDGAEFRIEVCSGR